MKPGEPQDAVASLYDEFGATLYCYALMILGRHDAAEDAVQQVFLALVRGRTSNIQDPGRYLRRAIRNACYSRLRSTASEGVDTDGTGRELLEVIPGNELSPVERMTLETAISQLPPEQREVLHLHAFEGLTFREIGDATGESANTAASRYRYALERLRGSFSEKKR
jgi:RNA polymerase sigma-70 factor (ECF subfamily)